MPNFSLRIIDASYYMEKPIEGLDCCVSEFRQTAIYHVPVIRIFGTTALGQKSCLHIHKVFPYLYVPLPAGIDNTLRFCKEFAMSLDSALTISFGKSVSQQRQHVYNVEIVKKIPFYGYYKNEKDFLQVYLYNPNHISLAGDLLINGSVMNQFFQPFETHIPFILQFFMDYNLHGMNFVNLSSVLFRTPLPKKDSFSNLNFRNSTSYTSDLFQSPSNLKSNTEVFTEETIHKSYWLYVKKQSTCAVEADAVESAILNKNSIMESLGTNPGLNELWEDEKQRLRDNNESSVIKINESQDRKEFITNEEMMSLKKLKDIIDEKRFKLKEDILNLSTTSEKDSHINGLLSTTLEQDSLALDSTADQSLVNILLNMAEEDELQNTLEPLSALSETSLINNGLDHEDEEEHDDEEDESILMSQTVNDIINDPNSLFSSTPPYIWSNALLEDQENQFVEISNNSRAENIRYGNTRDSIVSNKERENKETFFIPQLDGNSDLCRESSSEDFQSSSMKRKRKKSNKQIKSRKKSSIHEIDTTNCSSFCTQSNQSSLECKESHAGGNLKYSIKDNLVSPKVYPIRVKNKKYELHKVSDELHKVSSKPGFCSKDCLLKSSLNVTLDQKSFTQKTTLKPEKSEYFLKNKEILQKKYNLKTCQVVLFHQTPPSGETEAQLQRPFSKLRNCKNKLKYNMKSTTGKHFSNKKHKVQSNVNQVKSNSEFSVNQEDCFISESSGEIDCSKCLMTGVTSLTPFKETDINNLISSQFTEKNINTELNTCSNTEQTCSNTELNTCSNTEQTCSNTELNTCSNTEQTCSNTELNTCSNNELTTLNVDLKIFTSSNKETATLSETLTTLPETLATISGTRATLFETSALKTNIKDFCLKQQSSDFIQSNYSADFPQNSVFIEKSTETEIDKKTLFKKEQINMINNCSPINSFEDQISICSSINSFGDPINICSPINFCSDQNNICSPINSFSDQISICSPINSCSDQINICSPINSCSDQIKICSPINSCSDQISICSSINSFGDQITICSPINSKSSNDLLKEFIPSEQTDHYNLHSPNKPLNSNKNIFQNNFSDNFKYKRLPLTRQQHTNTIHKGTLCLDNFSQNSCAILDLNESLSQDIYKKENMSYDKTMFPFPFQDNITSADKNSAKKNKHNCLENTRKHCHKRLKYPISSVQNCSSVVFSDVKLSKNSYIYTPLEKPPSYNRVLNSLGKNNLQEIIYREPFYTDKKDIAGSLLEQNKLSYGIKVKALPKYSTNLPLVTIDFLQKVQFQQLHLDIFKSPSRYDQTQMYPLLADMLTSNKVVVITPCFQPPKYSTVLHWLLNQKECNSPVTRSLIPVKLESEHALQKKLLQHNPDIDNICLFPALAISPQSLNEPEVSTPYGAFKDPMVPFKVDEIQSHKKSFKCINSSDIEGFTPNNTYAFKTTQQNVANAKAIHYNQSITIISIELHIQTRRNLRPDPTIDPIVSIFYTMHQEQFYNNDFGVFITETSMSSQDSSNLLKKAGISISSTHCFSDELLMLKGFSSFIQEHDPEILVGYEVQMLSIGYLIERAAALNYNMCHAMSRISNSEVYSKKFHKEEKEDNWFGQLVSMEITGRIILNLWRVMRSEMALQIYTFENVFYHICHQRVAAYSFCSLSDWWLTNNLRWRVVDYYLKRSQGNIKLLEKIDFINRTSELARIFGILFYSVISRGSQFRVESMMLRIAKPMNFIPMSPSPHQRARMSAPECIPLVMEPESRFYVDPVIVLDFQSLYPSIIIAYNYCFSTCIGRVKLCAENELFNFGAASLNLPIHVLEELLNDSNVHISPNGVGFVKRNVRIGILPRMLDEILSTRVMVKSSMKKAKANKVLHKLLDSRQLGLKLIANVTYGYTAANFSGRMPCIEVGDSVVRKGRETLERAIHLVNSTEKWNAKVVYGDTDSLFVLLKGASKETAFAVSAEIVDAVSALNPKPIKLKFEKVYQPCFLITKKRYVGYMYESLDQKVPIFDAKGIETVRRDNCPAVGKVLEKSLRILFEKNDLSLVKKYVQNQFVKIMEGNVILRDFIIAKEYRGLNNYKPGACVPALALTRKQIKLDRRAEPRIGERVPYVIVHGSPGLTLIQLVRSPMELIYNNSLRLNEAYYITKQLCPSLGRIFSLIGVNVVKWFVDLPRITRINEREFEIDDNKKGMISHYFSSNHCLICSQLTNHKVCVDCRNDSQKTVMILNSKCRAVERRYIHFTTLCQHCTSTRLSQSNCISLDCPIFFKLSNITRDLQRTKEVRHLVSEF